MNKILTIIVAVIVCIAVAVGTYFLIIKKNNVSIIQTTSPNILYLTNPVLSFSGKIEAIQGNTITISQDMLLNQVSSLLVNPDQTSKVQTKKITYQVLVSDKTSINQMSGNIPYLFKQTALIPTLATPSANINKLSIKDLKTGQYIMASSATDLRTIIGNQFETTFINISPNTFSVYGKITKINNNEISVLGVTSNFSNLPVLGGQPATQEKEYIFTIDQNTEISGSVASNNPTIPSKPEKYSLSDLKKDQSVTIYAEGDVNSNQKTTALQISPLFITNLLLAQSLQSPPAQSTKSGTQKPK